MANSRSTSLASKWKCEVEMGTHTALPRALVVLEGTWRELWQILPLASPSFLAAWCKGRLWGLPPGLHASTSPSLFLELQCTVEVLKRLPSSPQNVELHPPVVSHISLLSLLLFALHSKSLIINFIMIYPLVSKPSGSDLG